MQSAQRAHPLSPPLSVEAAMPYSGSKEASHFGPCALEPRMGSVATTHSYLTLRIPRLASQVRFLSGGFTQEESRMRNPVGWTDDLCIGIVRRQPPENSCISVYLRIGEFLE